MTPATYCSNFVTPPPKAPHTFFSEIGEQEVEKDGDASGVVSIVVTIMADHLLWLACFGHRALSWMAILGVSHFVLSLVQKTVFQNRKYKYFERAKNLETETWFRPTYDATTDQLTMSQILSQNLSWLNWLLWQLGPLFIWNDQK